MSPALDFPNSPATGDVFPDPLLPGAPAWRWDGTKWVLLTSSTGAGGIEDAVHDGVLYGRKDGEWEPALEDAPHGALYGREDGAWENVDDAISTAISTAIAAIPPPAKDPIAISFVIPGKPPAGQTYLVPVVFPFEILASATESRAVARVGPAAAYTMQLGNFGAPSSLGSVTFAANAQTGTVTTNALAFGVGHTLRLTAQATEDANLADVGITLYARRL